MDDYFDFDLEETPRSNNNLITLSEVIQKHPNCWLYPISDDRDKLYENNPIISTFIVLDVERQANLNAFLAFNNPTNISIYTGKPKSVNYWFSKYLKPEQQEDIPKYRIVSTVVAELLDN